MGSIARIRTWSLENRLAAWGIAISATIALASGIAMPVWLSTRPAQATVINQNTTVVNNYLPPGDCPASTATTAVSSHDVSIDLQVRPSVSGACWETSWAGPAPALLEFQVSYRNTSAFDQKNVEVRVQLPKGLQILPHSTSQKDGIYPNGISTAGMDVLVTNGYIINTYAPGTNAYIRFFAFVASPIDLACGKSDLQVKAYAQPQGLNYFWNVAHVVIPSNDCKPS